MQGRSSTSHSPGEEVVHTLIWWQIVKVSSDNRMSLLSRPQHSMDASQSVLLHKIGPLRTQMHSIQIKSTLRGIAPKVRNPASVQGMEVRRVREARGKSFGHGKKHPTSALVNKGAPKQVIWEFMPQRTQDGGITVGLDPNGDIHPSKGRTEVCKFCTYPPTIITHATNEARDILKKKTERSRSDTGRRSRESLTSSIVRCGRNEGRAKRRRGGSRRRGRRGSSRKGGRQRHGRRACVQGIVGPST